MTPTKQRNRYHRSSWKQGILLCILAILCIAGLFGLKCWQIYQRGQVLRSDIQLLMAWAIEPITIERIDALGPLLIRCHADAEALRIESAPLLPATKLLGWVPSYGATISATQPLLDSAIDLISAANDSYQILVPLLHTTGAEPLGPLLLQRLTTQQQRIEAAQVTFDRADRTLQQLPLAQLDPTVRDPLLRMMPLLPSARAGMQLLHAAPKLLGSSTASEYLVIAQNPDELRATGGLITAAGRVVIKNGQVATAVITDSSGIDNIGQYIYPDPPKPLQHYMGMPIWLFRDANWSPDFPTTANTAIALYQLAHGGNTTGVIALDPAAIQLLLMATGPIRLKGSNELISADHVLDYMRDGVKPVPGDPTPWVVRRKAFLPPLTGALIERLNNPQGLNMLKLVGAFRAMLDQRHLQIALREPEAAAAMAEFGWDGALRPGSQDFLMLVDSNIGYNKANLYISQAISYTVDLSDPTAPVAMLTVRYTHHLQQQVSCDQSHGYKTVLTLQHYLEWADGCYWDYLRVYVPTGTQLISATMLPVPAAWMQSKIGDTGATSIEDAEQHLRMLGTLLVVPTNTTNTRTFWYRLPPTVLQQDAQTSHYRLIIQKQAAISASPLTITIRLPSQATMITSSLPVTSTAAQTYAITINLAHDQLFDLRFRDQ